MDPMLGTMDVESFIFNIKKKELQTELLLGAANSLFLEEFK